MTRFAVLILAAGLTPWAAEVSAQQALKTPLLIAPSRVRTARPTLDLQVLQAVAVTDPWRPSLSTAPITGLPRRLSWNKTHTALASAFVVTLMIDAAQTRALARDGWSNFREANPLLGERPSVGRINTYTALAGLTVLGAAAALPPRLRSWLLGGAIAVQAVTVGTSVHNGLPLRFP
ncbi:MAG TPA: hypothetical protein VJN39_05450 [Gemmatimonadales bacterium]|nr:hypothetical protein [Gemmatimonadales bacterium]